MAQELSDGQPLTYEWLNSLVKEIEALKSEVTFFGLPTGSKVSIVSKTDTNTIGAKSKADSINKKSVSFGHTFKTAPNVVAVVYDDISSTVVINSITTTGFTYTLKTVDDKTALGQKTSNTIKVNYIAIGESAY